MADETESLETTPSNGIGARIKKALIIWIPLFAFQLVASYLVIAKFIQPKVNPDSEQIEGEQAENLRSRQEVGTIFLIEDVIVNPMNSNGEKYLNVTVGLECKDNDQVEFLEKREVLVRDYLLSIFSSRTVEQLEGNENKEAMRKEIFEFISELLSKKGLINVYFHSFIIA